MEVLNTISHTRVSVEPMLVPEKILPLAKIKVDFILSFTRFPFQFWCMHVIKLFYRKNRRLARWRFPFFCINIRGIFGQFVGKDIVCL
jgi:hypothetical protein